MPISSSCGDVTSLGIFTKKLENDAPVLNVRNTRDTNRQRMLLSIRLCLLLAIVVHVCAIQCTSDTGDFGGDVQKAIADALVNCTGNAVVEVSIWDNGKNYTIDGSTYNYSVILRGNSLSVQDADIKFSRLSMVSLEGLNLFGNETRILFDTCNGVYFRNMSVQNLTTAISIIGSQVLSISGSIFSHNTNTIFAATAASIRVDQSNFLNNVVPSGSANALIYCTGGSINVTRSIFQGVTDRCIIPAQNTKHMTDNLLDTCALYFEANSSFVDTTFARNQVTQDFLIASADGLDAIIQNTTFESNTGPLMASHDLTVTNSTFRGNQLVDRLHYGLIYTSHALHITSSTLLQNGGTTPDFGVIRSETSITMENTNITENTFSSITFGQSAFLLCQPRVPSTTILPCPITITSVTCDSNSAASIAGCGITISNSTFRGNSDSSIFDLGNPQMRGSAFLDYAGTPDGSDGVIPMFTSFGGGIIIDSCDFYNNTMVAGVGNGGQSEINNSTFRNNTGTSISLTAGDLNVFNSTFFGGNSCPAIGGCAISVVAVFSQSNVNITGSHFSSYRAHQGAAVLLTNATVTLNGCLFSENHAETYGGAILSVKTALHVTKTRFKKNTANLYGGSIYETQDISLVISTPTPMPTGI
ncbi:polymorphic outer membrane protein [Planoprotostelium fungivorum]|uniref:Polymorphic outer membrane protein n=1 Tax=Planoprotostelium fungivorum TaxID=1890364 RepID=A0A2P6MUI9_9EUKA|nr:polymorphic outer membrane protein [Planoprotostelium fungivorum]PRP81661.1 polymorphic outer membrane protein [Planoprotostelium fungivorum]